MTARRRILEAAERLFAENGIEAVSLRQIAAAAGQRNTSAVAYHYGTKAALVEAVYAWRMAPVNAARLQRLAEIGARIGADTGTEPDQRGDAPDDRHAGADVPTSTPDDRRGDVTELIRALIEPLAATLLDAESGGEPTFYLRFMAETMRYPEYDPAAVAIDRPEAGSIRKLIALLRTAKGTSRIPPDVLSERMRLVAILAVTALADRERRTQEPGRPERQPAIGIEVVVNAAAAILSAPWP